MANKRDREKLRNRVKTALDRSGLTQKDLEALAGWPAGALSRVFSGKKNPDSEWLGTLADRLGTPPSELFAGTGWAELVRDEPTLESAPERTAESAPARVAVPEPTEASVEVTPAPAAEAAPAPAAEAAPAPKPEPEPEPARATEPDRGPRPEWKPPPEPRKRKRDLPFRVARWITGLVFGD